MAKLSILQKEVNKFEKLFGHGTYRPMKGCVEVRVRNDLDAAVISAKSTIEKNKLNLKVGKRLPELRSFELEVCNG